MNKRLHLTAGLYGLAIGVSILIGVLVGSGSAVDRAGDGAIGAMAAVIVLSLAGLGVSLVRAQRAWLRGREAGRTK